MALFGSKKNPLQRLQGLDWKTDADRNELFAEVAGLKRLKLKQIIWTITSSEAEVRQLGVRLLPRFQDDGLGQALMGELEGKNDGQQRFLIRQMAKCKVEEVQDIAGTLLTDPSSKRKKMGIALIDAVPVAKAGGLIRQLLDDPSPDVRLVGLKKLLGQPDVLQDQGLRPKIIGMARDSDERIRVAVYQTMAAAPTKDAEIWDLLVVGIKDEAYTVQQLSSKLLGDRIKAGDDDLEQALYPVKAMLGFYIGGMGSKKSNFHKDLMARMGFADEAENIQNLFFEGKRDEAIAAVPDQFADEISLSGPLDRIRERLEDWKRSPVTSLLINGDEKLLRTMAELVL